MNTQTVEPLTVEAAELFFAFADIFKTEYNGTVTHKIEHGRWIIYRHVLYIDGVIDLWFDMMTCDKYDGMGPKDWRHMGSDLATVLSSAQRVEEMF